MRSLRESDRTVAILLTVAVVLGVSLSAKAQTTHDIIVRDFVFDPATVDADPGDIINWVWESGVHSVTSGATCAFDGGFNALVDAANPLFTYVIPSNFIGVIPYYCLPHCGILMTGKIRVDHRDWPAIFDPLQVRTLNLGINPVSWDIIRHDLTFSLEFTALFWEGNDTPIPVRVRRKSSDALPSEADPQKVGLKIDVNDLVTGQKWHQLTKLSLETGDQVDPVVEGLAWNLQRAASTAIGYGYDAGYGSWVRLNVNGAYVGLYVNAEQRNKQALRNRGLYTAGETWLYKAVGPSQAELPVGLPHSPTFDALCYPPFFAMLAEGDAVQQCATPDNATQAAELPISINMPGMLTTWAVNAFVANSDSVFSHEQNGYFVDFLPVLTGLTSNERLPLDTVFDSLNLVGATVANLDDDPDDADADWATATTENVTTVVHAEFPRPSDLLAAGVGLQEFRVSVRKNAASGTGTPTARLELWQDGLLVRAGLDVAVTADSTSQQVISLVWSAAEVISTGSVECKFVGTKSGGSPGNRASVDAGAIEWNAEVATVLQVVQRMYLPWDLDTSLPDILDTTFDIYIGGSATPYQTILFGNPTFRAQYSQIFNDLLCGPLSEAEIIAQVDAYELVITQALLDDPNNNMPLGVTVAQRFDQIRGWISQRVVNVAGQIDNFVPCTPGCVWDCGGDNDGVVSIVDFLALLAQWGSVGSTCDFDGGGVGIVDFLELLANWGGCP